MWPNIKRFRGRLVLLVSLMGWMVAAGYLITVAPADLYKGDYGG